jgi:hypothetical protein
MATLSQILAEQAKLINDAKKNLEAAQKKAPPTTAPVAVKEATVNDLKARVKNLTVAKTDTVRQIDDQIAVYEGEIAALEKQIEEDKKQLTDQPPRPRPTPVRGRRRK